MSDILSPDLANAVDLDEWAFHHYLAGDSDTDVLVVGCLDRLVRRVASERGVALPQQSTRVYVERNGRQEPAGYDTRTTAAAADIIEAAILAAIGTLRAMTEDGCRTDRDGPAVLDEDLGLTVRSVPDDEGGIVSLSAEAWPDGRDGWSFTAHEARTLAHALLAHAARAEAGL